MNSTRSFTSYKKLVKSYTLSWITIQQEDTSLWYETSSNENVFGFIGIIVILSQPDSVNC